MRKRKIIIVVVLLGLLLGGVAMLFLSRGSGPPIKVEGDLSAKDVAQIKGAVRRHLWREAFPNFSMQTLKALPGAVKLAWTTRITVIQGNPNLAEVSFSGSVSRTNLLDTCSFTNGPAGWTWSYAYYFSPD